jgi:hypothetical protein
VPKHLRIHVQAAIFGENSGICKTGTQQPLPSAAEFGNFWLKACTEMQRSTAVRNRVSENRTV